LGDGLGDATGDALKEMAHHKMQYITNGLHGKDYN
jgi:hypothetical protein